MKSVLQLQRAFKSIGGASILEDTGLSVFEGGFHSIIGGTGAGKSTLMKILAGLEHPDKGELSFSGHRSDIFFIHDSYDLLFPMNLLEMIKTYRYIYPFWCNDIFNHLRRERKFSIRKNFQELSDTHKKQFLLIMALATKSKLILVDDFSSAMDSECQEYFLKELKLYTARGGAVVVTGRDSTMIERPGNYLFTLENKKILEKKESGLERLVA